MTMTFVLDPSSGVPIYRQIIDQVRYGIAAGRLRPGNQLPTVRALAVELSVNPNTVIKAYTELERDGVVTTEQGTGTFVAAQEQPPVSGADQKAKLRALCLEFLANAQRYGFTHDEVARMIDALRSQNLRNSRNPRNPPD